VLHVLAKALMRRRVSVLLDPLRTPQERVAPVSAASRETFTGNMGDASGQSGDP